MPEPIIVIGAGVAGLAAAVECAAAGRRVLVFERNHYAGGRARSFRDDTAGDIIDNGQHLLMGCYTATRRYLGRIGTEHLAYLQPSLRIPYLRAVFATAEFSAVRLPAPFHVLGGLLRFAPLSSSERWQLRALAGTLLTSSGWKEQELDTMTADEWLTSLGQGPEARRYLWDVITIGALNDHPRNVSALLLYRVLRTAFFGARTNASLMIPTVGLSELLVDPAIQFIESHSGSVRLSIGVEHILVEKERVTGVQLNDGTSVPASAVISTVPWYSFHQLTKSSFPFPHSSITNQQSIFASSFSPSTILSLHLWFDRTVMHQDFAAVLDKRIQWIFAKRSVIPHAQRLTLVISGANALVELSKEELVADAMRDLEQLLPDIETAKLIHSVVIKEKRATFVPRPGLESLRPGTETEISNFFLAGDWTNTGYPATIEGGVMSGEKAGKRVLRQAQDESARGRVIG